MKKVTVFHLTINILSCTAVLQNFISKFVQRKAIIHVRTYRLSDLPLKCPSFCYGKQMGREADVTSQPQHQSAALTEAVNLVKGSRQKVRYNDRVSNEKCYDQCATLRCLYVAYGYDITSASRPTLFKQNKSSDTLIADHSNGKLLVSLTKFLHETLHECCIRQYLDD